MGHYRLVISALYVGLFVRLTGPFVIMVYFSTYFSPFSSNFKTFFLLFHMLMTHEQQDKTQDIIVLVQNNKHRLQCTQDGFPQDGLTASSYHLIPDHRTIKGHVELLNPPLSHQLINPSMLLHHILDLSRHQS